jgi:PKD repeat protein
MLRTKFAAAVLAASLVGGLSAQTKLTTLFAGGNGGSAGGAVYFDITVNNTVRISSLEMNYSAAANTVCGVNVYTVPKTYIGNEANKAAWTLVGKDDGKAVCAGVGLPTKINLASAILLTPGTYGIALESVGSGNTYTNGTATNNSYKDSNLALALGAAGNVAFSGTPFTPRIWNGSIVYTLGKGIFSNFTADKTSGPGPLTVKFTDATYSSAPPILTWAWDFNGDNKIDSKLQNPTYTFPKTTWDAQYDVTLTTTDATNGSSKVTKKAFITVDPSTPTAVNFGSGSANKPLPTPIGQPANNAHYSYTAVRGFSFTAPTTFVINGFEAPNTYTTVKQTHQTVTCYVLKTAIAGNYTPVAADIKFHGTGPANTILKPAAPIVVNKGDWVGVIGACHLVATTSNNHNSYGVGPHKTTVLGMPITLTRLIMQTDHKTNKGLAVIAPSSGSLGRVNVHVVGNNTVPTMTTIGLPKLGSTPKLDISAEISGAQGGIVLLSAGRLPVPVPTAFGKLLINPAFAASIFVATGSGQVPLPIPNSSVLTGVTVDWQSMVFNLTTNTFGMTNGSEWFLGK